MVSFFSKVHSAVGFIHELNGNLNFFKIVYHVRQANSEVFHDLY